MKEDSISGCSAWGNASGRSDIHMYELGRYSSEFSVSSCLSTFVCEVSRISPARNISSTTLYTL